MQKWKKEKKIEFLLNKRNAMKEAYCNHKNKLFEKSSDLEISDEFLVDSFVFPREFQDDILRIFKEVQQSIEIMRNDSLSREKNNNLLEEKRSNLAFLMRQVECFDYRK